MHQLLDLRFTVVARASKKKKIVSRHEMNKRISSLAILNKLISNITTRHLEIGIHNKRLPESICRSLTLWPWLVRRRGKWLPLPA